MTITIEAGKFYETRDGQKVGPIVQRNVHDEYVWMHKDGKQCRIFRADGSSYRGRQGDIIAEWHEPTDQAATAAVEGQQPGDDDWFSTHLADGAPAPEIEDDGFVTVTNGDVIPDVKPFLRSEQSEAKICEAAAKAGIEDIDGLLLHADIKTEIADEAKRIVSGARRAAYGKPEQNFERIARFWQGYFENTGRGDVKITAADVSPMMRLMKEARLCETPDHRDSFVDLVGYTLTGAEVNGVKSSA